MLGQDERTLDSAEQALRERGFEGLEPADGRSEWELFTSVIERDEERFNARVDAALAATASPADALIGVIETCVRDHDWTFWIELWSLALRDERAGALRERLDRAFRERIAEVVEAGRSLGEFEVEDVPATAIAIATLIDALAVEATLGDDTVSPNFMFRAVAATASRLTGAALEPGTGSDGGG